MRTVPAMAVAVALVAGVYSIAPAADEKTPNPRQERMKACNTQAGDKKGDEREAFMAQCVAVGGSEEAWAALAQGGHVALIRHGNAPPGYGEKPGFRIDECRTQRNLDERGRGEARALGEAFRAHGVRAGRVLSSPWCRCMDTAHLMAVGPVEISSALVPDSSAGVVGVDPKPRIREIKEMVAAWRGPGTLVLVTHGLTVRALLGFVPIQGEVVVLKPSWASPAGGDLVGMIAAPD